MLDDSVVDRLKEGEFRRAEIVLAAAHAPFALAIGDWGFEADATGTRLLPVRCPRPRPSVSSGLPGYGSLIDRLTLDQDASRRSERDAAVAIPTAARSSRSGDRAALAACKPQTEGLEEIRWGRESCAICGMIISDPRSGWKSGRPRARLLARRSRRTHALHWLSRSCRTGPTP
ncbi:MAG: hypothetical protein R3D59_14085 [Paracoccaceae bacterium]